MTRLTLEGGGGRQGRVLFFHMSQKVFSPFVIQNPGLCERGGGRGQGSNAPSAPCAVLCKQHTQATRSEVSCDQGCASFGNSKGKSAAHPTLQSALCILGGVHRGACATPLLSWGPPDAYQKQSALVTRTKEQKLLQTFLASDNMSCVQSQSQS